MKLSSWTVGTLAELGLEIMNASGVDNRQPGTPISIHTLWSLEIVEVQSCRLSLSSGLLSSSFVDRFVDIITHVVDMHGVE